MSSAYVRTQFKNFIASEIAPEALVDFTGEFRDLSDILSENSIVREPWMAIEFQGDTEVPITVGSDNVVGKYRESGAVFIHVVDIAKLGNAGNILLRAENLRTALRGRRLGTVIVESTTLPNFSDGATLQFENGWMSATFIVAYEADIDL